MLGAFCIHEELIQKADSRMGSRMSSLFLLILMCASHGMTQFTNSSSTQYTTSQSSHFTNISSTRVTNISSSYVTNISIPVFNTSQSPDTESYDCIERAGTSLTVLMDEYIMYWGYSYYYNLTLSHLSSRFPCVTRQYTTVTLDYAETNETITDEKSVFVQSISRPWDYDFSYIYYNHIQNCNQSLLYGLKRALEISPAESVIVVHTTGSMVDYNDTQLLSDVNKLLEKKKSQVYFLWYSWYCAMSDPQREVFQGISSLSYGKLIDMNYSDYHTIMRSLEVLLSKPLNSSVRILNVNLNVTVKYTVTFNVPASLTYLLITLNELNDLNITDPNGYTFTFDTTSYSSFYYYYYTSPSSYLVKSPAAGSWILSAQGNDTLFVQILGFTGLDKLGSCLDSVCHSNASCSEFGGYGECTCKEGFTGDGTSCTDIDECQDYYNKCQYYGGGSCVNTLGSYTCNCSSGFQYIEEIGCVDIDECANSSLNDCDPVAKCSNYYYGYYTCTCPYGYYGDGRHCEVNECQQGSPCGTNEDCIKYPGSYSCINPCSNYTLLNDPWRSTSNTYNYWYYYYYNWYHCDNYLSGWYRFKGEFDQQIPEHCIPSYSCGTYAPIWMNGSHPTVSDGIVNRTACTNWYDGCCIQSFNISVKMCPDGFYVYKLQNTPNCNAAYCTESNYSCSGKDCAPDEECRIVGGVYGCYCKDLSYTNNAIQPENVEVTCGLDNIEVRLSKCLLEKMRYDTTSIHLKDNSCRGVIERSDKSYITLITRASSGSCGGDIWNNGSDITYKNTVYLASQPDGVIIRDEYPIDIYCSYPADMEINLLSGISTYVASAPISVNGGANFTIKMGLFQDSDYTIPYTNSYVYLDSSSMLYVGVIVSGATSSSQFVVVMKNCYTTPTADSSYGPTYDIIKDRCPNRNDPTISVQENGASLKGHFKLQVFKFLGGYSQIYLHCQIGLCDTSSSDCMVMCPLMRSALDGVDNEKNMTVGPINQKAIQASDAAFQSSGGGTAGPIAMLLMATIAFLLLLY